MQKPSYCWCNWWHTAYRKTRTEDPREDPLTWNIKEEPTTEYLKEEPITEDPKEDSEEDPIQDPIKHWPHHVGYVVVVIEEVVEIKNNIASMGGESLVFKI